MKKLSVLFSILVLSVLMSMTLMAEEKHGHDHDKDHKHKEGHIKATHGGKVLEVGKHVAHIEVVHKIKEGSITLYILDKAGKAMAIADAPRLNLRFVEGKEKKKKQLKTTGHNVKENKSFEYKAEDALLKTKGFSGKIAIKIGDKKYKVELSHGDHDGHKGGDHKGHDHDDHKGHKH